MDNLIGASISVISNQEIRYDGVLFSINTAESSIVLKDGTAFAIFILFEFPPILVEEVGDKIEERGCSIQRQKIDRRRWARFSKE